MGLAVTRKSVILRMNQIGVDPVNLRIIGEPKDERIKKDIGLLQRAIERRAIARNREDGGRRPRPGLLKPACLHPKHERVSREIAGTFGKRVMAFFSPSASGNFKGAVSTRKRLGVFWINTRNPRQTAHNLFHCRGAVCPLSGRCSC